VNTVSASFKTIMGKWPKCLSKKRKPRLRVATGWKYIAHERFSLELVKKRRKLHIHLHLHESRAQIRGLLPTARGPKPFRSDRKDTLTNNEKITHLRKFVDVEECNIPQNNGHYVRRPRDCHLV